MGLARRLASSNGRGRRRAGAGALALAASMLLFGCSDAEALPRFDAPRTLAGEEVPAETLNRGRDLYVKYCVACHGARGDGKGPAASGLAPRDFTTGDFRAKSTPGDELPTHEDVVAMIRDGAVDRGMPAWKGLAPEDLDALAHFVETFSPRWSGARADDDHAE